MGRKNNRGKVRPKKSLGQHFLTDVGVAIDISQIFEKNDLPVLEIGPGTGALTQHLMGIYGKKLHVVEIDDRSVTYLRRYLRPISSRIIEEDFLQMDIPAHFPKGVNIIGNFPYHISSQILFKVLDNAEYVPQFGGMFQKEVAERICAEPSNKAYGQLTLIRELQYNAKYLFDVPPHAFDPQPKVISGVLVMNRNKKELGGVDEKALKRMIKQGFSQRRKKMRNSLKQYFTEEQLVNEIFDMRPEQLNLDDFIALAKEANFSKK